MNYEDKQYICHSCDADKTRKSVFLKVEVPSDDTLNRTFCFECGAAKVLRIAAEKMENIENIAGMTAH